jgi:hypothetical protein
LYATHLSAILGRLLIDQDEEEEDVSISSFLNKRKAIFLGYGKDAENWAHQDQRCDDGISVQAVLLTSRPGTEFTGGEFYVARQWPTKTTSVGGTADSTSATTTRLCIEQNVVEWENAGDLVLFLSSKEWWHGMKRVRPASNDDDDFQTEDGEYIRQAIGLLQPR